MAFSTDIILNEAIRRYVIRERIGAGGMARVFRAWDKNLERDVAVKVLHDHLASQASFNERFDREAKLVASLQHPNIVQIYDFDTIEYQGQFLSYMVMPYLPGKTLRQLLDDYIEQRQTMPTSEIVRIINDLCAALGYAHSKGMVHRDVKPGNVLFGEYGQAVLMDFGIARLREGASLTQEGATVGTPAYISPEQASGRPADARSDLYALGIMIYEMFAGSPPFNDESLVAIILKHVSAPIPLLPDAIRESHPYLQSFLLKALAKDPEDRYQSAAALIQGLNEALSSQSPYPVHASPAIEAQERTVIEPLPSSAEQRTLLLENPSAPAAGRHRQLRWIISGMALVSFALVVLFAIARGQERNAASATDDTISSMTGSAPPYFVSDFSSDDPMRALWQQNDEGTALRQMTADGIYRLENRSRSTAITSLFDPEATYQDGTITLEGRLDTSSSPMSGYGIVFRYQDARNYNVFAVDGAGQYSIWALRNAEWSELRNQETEWTPNDVINPLGEMNQLTVVFAGEHLVGMVNQQVVADVVIPTEEARAGAIGIYIASTNTGEAVALIDSYQITDDIPSMTSQ